MLGGVVLPLLGLQAATTHPSICKLSNEDLCTLFAFLIRVQGNIIGKRPL